ncbi:hypothetical protein [Streptomyces palmae]|uniref:Glycosyltransferase family 2 protein n=1 Tax=Streptomyces palmae TaxID=1701085 RepID=A0A4Z0GKU6_9ACTN|nr:hypothetical protein [Streptomyces palmae]TGA97313.1 hypothetical protein E4099_23620 [Streptomyces palmae]
MTMRPGPAPPPPVRGRHARLDGRLAVVSCYFNPCRYGSRRANLHAFLAGMRALRVPFRMVELSFDGHFELPADDSRHLRLTGRHVMWHKERLLNLATASLPPTVDKVAWVDADVLFPDRDWYPHACALLESFDLVQLFREAVEAGPATGGTPDRGELSGPGIAYAVATGLPDPFRFNRSSARPGVAWAARRELLEGPGLFDTMITGGADTMLALAAYGYYEHPLARRLPAPLRDSWRDWALEVHRRVQGRVGWVPQTVTTLWHGTAARRRHVERLGILTAAAFDPRHDLTADSQGVFGWASDKPALHEQVRAYFEGRQEDSAP